MIDHCGIQTKNFKTSKKFYDEVLKTLGGKALHEINIEGIDIAGFGRKFAPTFWIHQGEQPKPPIHIAFSAKNRKQVDEFYKIAMKNGAKDNGKPGVRTQYHKYYYGAFVIDPDGNNVEAVCHLPPAIAALRSLIS